MGSRGLTESLRILRVFQMRVPRGDVKGDLADVLVKRFGEDNVDSFEDGTLFAHKEGMIVAPISLKHVEKHLSAIADSKPQAVKQVREKHEEKVEEEHVDDTLDCVINHKGNSRAFDEDRLVTIYFVDKNEFLCEKHLGDRPVKKKYEKHVNICSVCNEWMA